MDFLAEECRANPPLDPARPVRLPGEQATRNIEKARVEGVPLSASTVAALVKRAQRLGVDTSILSERALPDRQRAVG
jgi:LDH2 family malate/lactate/ureidoglycolate dehydrogenase